MLRLDCLAMYRPFPTPLYVAESGCSCSSEGAVVEGCIQNTLSPFRRLGRHQEQRSRNGVRGRGNGRGVGAHDYSLIDGYPEQLMIRRGKIQLQPLELRSLKAIHDFFLYLY